MKQIYVLHILNVIVATVTQAYSDITDNMLHMQVSLY
jgi:hypothetical protein